MENMELGEDQEKSKPVKNISVSRRIRNAIRERQGSNGVSFPELKKYLRDSKKLDYKVHASEMKLALKNYVDRCVLTKENGLYKVNTSAKSGAVRKVAKARAVDKAKARKVLLASSQKHPEGSVRAPDVIPIRLPSVAEE